MPHRVAVKLYADPDPGPGLDLHPFIAMFHGFIQRGAVEGLLVDVADYAHVPDGPGVMLIGHDVDYAIDRTDGRTGLLVTRKRQGDAPAARQVRDALRMALGMAVAIEADGSAGLRVSTAEIEVRVLDRLVAPNDEAGYEALAKDLEPLWRELHGDASPELSRGQARDAREPLAARVTAPGAPDAATLLERLGGARTAAAPAGAEVPLDISVEDLAALRESGEDFVLLDVREPDEYAVCNLGGTLIPLGELEARMDELDRGARIVVHCKVGGRGGKGADLLRRAGFPRVSNVEGGILAWIDRIDPSLERY